jgi:hypothetical protein
MLSGGTAYAGTAFTGYDETVPLVSAYAFTGNYDKTTDLDGNIRVATVGGDYKIDARMSPQTITFAPPATGLTDGSNAVLPKGGTVKGGSPYLAVNGSAWYTVTVRTTGTWRSN